MNTQLRTSSLSLGLVFLLPILVSTGCAAEGESTGDAAGGGDTGTSSSSSGAGATSGAGGEGAGTGAGSGGMTGSTSSTGAGGMPPTPDTTPPSIVSVDPPDGAVGVTDQAIVTVTFSEPMDKTSVQAAFQSASLGAVTFNWPDDQTVEVTPNGLAYAAGGPDVAAQVYDYSVTTVAEDLAGNPLPANVDVSFSTLREVTDFMPETFEGAVGLDGTLWTLSGGVMPVGRVVYGQFNQFNATPRLLLDFDISGIPAAATILLAEIDCGYASRFGAKPPATDSFDHVSYNTNNRAAGYAASSLASYADPLGFGLMFFPSPPPRLTENVTAPLMAQRAASSTLLQFRLTVPTNAQGATENYLIWRDTQHPNAGCGPQALSVVYLTP